MRHLLEPARSPLPCWCGASKWWRTGILRVFGATLAPIDRARACTQLLAVILRGGVMTVVQSSTATALIVSAFVGQGMISLTAALTVMLGADVGSAADGWWCSR